MTAETLKPFITPTSAVNNFPAKHSGVTQPTKRKIKNLIPIVLCIIAVALVIGIFGLTVSVYVFFLSNSKLESQLKLDFEDQIFI